MEAPIIYLQKYLIHFLKITATLLRPSSHPRRKRMEIKDLNGWYIPQKQLELSLTACMPGVVFC